MSIATQGALTDVPRDTANILAWNGGGESNYSSIIAQGGYEQTIRLDYGKIEEEVEKDAKKFTEAVQHIGKHVEDFVSEELMEIFRELKSE